MADVDNNPRDGVRRGRNECIRCGHTKNLSTVPFRGRYATLCPQCLRRVQR